MKEKWVSLTVGKSKVEVAKDDDNMESVKVTRSGDHRHDDEEDSWGDLLPSFAKRRPAASADDEDYDAGDQKKVKRSKATPKAKRAKASPKPKTCAIIGVIKHNTKDTAGGKPVYASHQAMNISRMKELLSQASGALEAVGDNAGLEHVQASRVDAVTRRLNQQIENEEFRRSLLAKNTRKQ